MDYSECKAMYKVMRSHLRMIDGVLYKALRDKERGKEFPHSPSGFERKPIEDVEEALDILDVKCGYSPSSSLYRHSREMLGDIYNDYGDMLE